MVGEIRGFRNRSYRRSTAALTGHLGAPTLHTETAASAIPRLLDLGVEGFLLGSDACAGVIAANGLVRILCDRCKPSAWRSTRRISPPTRANAALGFKGRRDVARARAAATVAAAAAYRGRNGASRSSRSTRASGP